MTKKKELPIFATPISGWVLVAREESNSETGERKGDWMVAWDGVFSKRRSAESFARNNSWPKGWRAVRGALTAFTR